MGFRNLQRAGSTASTTGAAVADATVMPIIIAMLTDGRDGDADLDGVNQVPWATLSGSTYTAIRLPLPNNCRVRGIATLNMAGFAGPWCRGALDVELLGVIHDDGANAVGQTGGVLRAAGTFAATTAGGTGGNAAANGGVATNSTVEGPTAGRFAGTAGGAGAATTGGVPATATALGVTRGVTHGMLIGAGGTNLSQLGTNAYTSGSGGNGGGGGAAAAGGGGGAPGGQLHFCARTVNNLGRISANGGNGAAGAGAGAGGGTGGSGGRVYYYAGTYTGNLPEVNAGGGGAPGDATAFYGHGGMQGELICLNPQTTLGARYTLTASQRTAAIVAGILDVSGSCTVGSDCGISTGVASTGTGGGDILLFEGTSVDGAIKLRFNATNFRLDLYVRGVVVLSTAALNAAAAGPTFHPFKAGDRIDWRIWYDPAGGARSMGIRWFVNHCGGLDTTGAGSGSALAAMTLAYSYGAGAAASSYIAQSRAADVVGKVCVLGDSITAPRQASIGIDGMSIGSRFGLATSIPIVSLAKSGGKIPDQTVVWQGSTMRGAAGLAAVVITLGHNDVGNGDSVATMAGNLNTLTADIRAQNPAAKIIICKLTPALSALTLATQAAWTGLNTAIGGGGGTPVTNTDAVVSSHQAVMGDVNLSLKMRCDANDFTHPNFTGRSAHATAAAAGLAAVGVV